MYPTKPAWTSRLAAITSRKIVRWHHAGAALAGGTLANAQARGACVRRGSAYSPDSAPATAPCVGSSALRIRQMIGRMASGKAVSCPDIAPPFSTTHCVPRLRSCRNDHSAANKPPWFAVSHCGTRSSDRGQILAKVMRDDGNGCAPMIHLAGKARHLYDALHCACAEMASRIEELCLGRFADCAGCHPRQSSQL